jgi:ribonuclease P/MRP protein subunit RPP1
MKRAFADLHLRVNPKEPLLAPLLVSKAAELGYHVVAVAVSAEAKKSELQALQTQCAEAGLDFVSRVDLYPRNPNDLLNVLRKVRRRFEIVCVMCENKDVARQAAKDRRVDLLSFPLLDYRRRFFDHAEAELASSAVAGYEVDVKPLLVLDGPARVRFLSSLRREVAVALEFHLPLVVSSGVFEPLLLRKPREMALLASLAGLTGVAALDAVSVAPVGLVIRNRDKLSEGFVAPGIRIIKQGDCVEEN